MADYKGVLADLRAKLATLDHERADLTIAIAAIERLVVTAPSSDHVTKIQAAVVGLSPRAFVSMTMPEAITKALKMLQQPQTTSQIKDILRAGGTKVGKSFNPHVYNTLKRLSDANGTIRRESDGRWGLREKPAQADLRPADDPAKMDWLPKEMSR